MRILNYRTLKAIHSDAFVLENAPERVLQFGEGNFLRGFVDYFFDILNETQAFNGKIVVIQPIEHGKSKEINEQQGLYTLYLRGLENGKKIQKKRLVSAISRAIDPYTDFQNFLKNAENPNLRFIVSNTTEAGIVFNGNDTADGAPPASFPAKLTRFLMERYAHFGKQNGKGFVVLPCELIDNNGEELKRCVLEYAKLWEQPDGFLQWIEDENLFCNTLVDRIVTGYPANEAQTLNLENGYEDRLIDTGEIFGFWAIEAPEWLREELPFEQAGLPVRIVDDQAPYKKRKVRILNGAQTGVTLAAYLAGYDIERDYMDDPLMEGFVKRMIFEEIIPVTELPHDDMFSFADEALDRLKNPFIDHSLLAISLNTVAKWKARILPTFKDYYRKNHKIPACIAFSMAALLAFYTGDQIRNGALIGHRNGKEYLVSDDREVLEFFREYSTSLPDEDYVRKYLAELRFLGDNLTKYPGFVETVTEFLTIIRREGVAAAVRKAVGQ